MRTNLSKLFRLGKLKTEDQKREIHNYTVVRNGRGIILLPTNAVVEDIRNHVGGLSPPR